MIEETKRVLHQEESDKAYDIKDHTHSEDLRRNQLEVKPDNRQESRTSFLSYELLICSLLLWSLLFLKDSSYGKSIIDSVSDILSQKIYIEPVASIISQLSEAVTQIF